jgi:hypothetical protein
MNQDDPASPPPASLQDDRLERYLDGLMTAAEQTAFEAQIAADPVLSAQVTAHARLTGALGQMFDVKNLPAAADALPATLPLNPSPARPRNTRLLRIAGVAAAVVLPLCAAAYFFMLPKTPTPVVIKPQSSEEIQKRNRDYMVAEYSRQVASGFKPKEICTTDEQFAKWTKEAFGHTLSPTHPAAGSGAPAEPVLAGWSKGTAFSSYSGLLLAHVDGKPVMVVMDNAPPDRMVPPDDATSNPRLFRRKVNEVWMIEITPLDQPRVITNIEAGPQ